MKDIVPLHKDNRNCYEDVIVTICSYFQRRYEYMYKYSWAFNYERTEISEITSLGKYLKYSNPKRRILLSEYSGIGMFLHKYEDLNKGLEDIKIKLNRNIPVALGSMDMFWLPWTPSYQNAHGGHTIIATGFDDSTSSILCMDPYFKMDKLKLSIDDFSLSSSGKYISFYVIGEEKKNLDANFIVNSAANKVLKEKSSGNSFDDMRKFADDIELYYNAKNEMAGYENYFSVPIYNTLQRIGQGRKQFGELLLFLAETSPKKKILENYSDKFDLMGKKWDALKVLFGKEAFLSNYKLVKSKAPNKIRDIANYEEAIAIELQNSDFN